MSTLRALAAVIAAVVAVILQGTPAQAAIKTQYVEYMHGTTPLKGYLAYDENVKGKRPGVLVVHEWWGHNEFARKRARMLAKRGQPEAERLADVFCRESRIRIRRVFASLDGKNDGAHYRLAQEVLRGEHTWLEEGIMAPPSSLGTPDLEDRSTADPSQSPVSVAR